jgi:hypothetical protein
MANSHHGKHEGSNAKHPAQNPAHSEKANQEWNSSKPNQWSKDYDAAQSASKPGQPAKNAANPAYEKGNFNQSKFKNQKSSVQPSYGPKSSDKGGRGK